MQYAQSLFMPGMSMYLFTLSVKGSAWMLRSCVTRVQILEMGRKWTTREGNTLVQNMKRIQRRMIFWLHHLIEIVLPCSIKQ